MSHLDEDVRAADALGISYGYYKAMTYDPSMTMGPLQKSSRKKKERRFTDEQAFLLWQQGKSDTDIAFACGVSRQCIQKWRDQLELPLLSRICVDPTKYRLARLQDGTVVAINSDEL
ncbi:MAG: hypothetical protein ACI4PO_03855 [Faecousia sp.]